MQKLRYVALGIWACFANTASAQAPGPGPSTAYPAKKVRILVGFAPGGGIDAQGALLFAAVHRIDGTVVRGG